MLVPLLAERSNSYRALDEPQPLHPGVRASTVCEDIVVTVTTHRLELIPFFCPIAPVMHPRVEEVEARSIAWATAMGLCPDERQRTRLEATKAAHFYAGMIPEGSQDRLEIAAQWIYWGFAFDDAWCDEESASSRPDRLVHQAGRLLRTIETLDVRLAEYDPFLLALHDLALRYRARATPVQMRRWVEANRLWLFGVVQRNTHRAQGAQLGIDEYLAVRLHDCGGPPTQSMYEFVHGPEVPGYEMDSPPVRAITECMWMIAAWDNDRVSRHKELLAEKDDYNIIDVLQREHGWSVEEATEEAVSLRDRTMCLFLRLRDALMPGASAPLRAYLAALGHGIRNNIDWSLDVPRYGTIWTSGSPSVLARIELSASVIDEPLDASPDPPPYPSIAWWWEQLNELNEIHAR